MVVSVTLLDRSIGQSGNVLYTFSDGFIVEYCSEADAEGDAVLDADRVKSVLRELLLSMAEQIDSTGSITATYNDADPDGNVVKVAL